MEYIGPKSADEIDRVAQERFGLDYLFPFQRLVITNILSAATASEKRDPDQLVVDRDAIDRDDAVRGRQIVILPTGAGKSLCFLLPAALLPGTTLVVYPLVSLMGDQERRIREAGFAVAQLRGGQDEKTRREVYSRIRSGTLDFLLSNPETLAGAPVLEQLRGGVIHHLVVDEAHSIAEWGDTFRPAYLELERIVSTITPPLVTAFTATASDHVIDRIREVLFGQTGAHLIRGNPDRENISYTVQPALSLSHGLRTLFPAVTAAAATGTGRSRGAGSIGDDDDALLPVFTPGEVPARPAIVFCATRFDTQRAAAIIGTSLGKEHVAFYHAGLTREKKRWTEEWFFSSEDGVLCATCAYGMGVDKGDIRTVIHSYVPETVEAYLQESGRAGRDRAPAQAIVLVTPEAQRSYLERRLGGAETAVDRAIFGTECRRRVLVEALGGTIDACAGCDICAVRYDREDTDGPTPHPLPRRSEAAAQMLCSIGSARTPRAVSAWVRIWRGDPHWSDGTWNLRRTCGFGAFAGWTIGELEEGVTGLERLGSLETEPYLRLAHVTPTEEAPTLPFRSDGDKKGPRRPYPRFGRALRLPRRRRPQMSGDTRSEMNQPPPAPPRPTTEDDRRFEFGSTIAPRSHPAGADTPETR